MSTESIPDDPDPTNCINGDVATISFSRTEEGAIFVYHNEAKNGMLVHREIELLKKTGNLALASTIENELAIWEAANPIPRVEIQNRYNSPLTSAMMAEPFQYLNGERGFFVLTPDGWKTTTLDGLSDEKELRKLMEERFSKADLTPYLPGEPCLESDDPTLFDDLVQMIKGPVELPKEELNPVIASYAICSYLPEWFEYFPRAYVNAPTEHGKGRLRNIIEGTIYRARCYVMPTSAVLAHDLNQGDSVIIDEWQGITKEEKPKVRTIVKIGWEKGADYRRMSEDRNRVNSSKVEGLCVIMGKRLDDLEEDDLNRGIMIVMRKRTRAVTGKLKPNGPEMARLRARLFSLRCRMLSGKICLEPYMRSAEELSRGEIKIDGKIIDFSDRPREILQTLLVPFLIYGKDPEPLYRVIADSMKGAEDDKRQTLEAYVWYALQAVIKTSNENKGKKLTDIEFGVRCPEDIWVKAVAEQLNTDQAERGEIKEIDNGYKPKTVGKILKKPLGFTTERKRDGYRLVQTDFKEAYQSCLKAYGSRYDEE
jgi:hypothetical protein